MIALVSRTPELSGEECRTLCGVFLATSMRSVRHDVVADLAKLAPLFVRAGGEELGIQLVEAIRDAGEWLR